MRRVLVAVLASFLWLACGGDADTNPFEPGPDAKPDRAGAAGTGGRPADPSSDRTGTTMGGAAGAGMGGAAGAGMGGAAGAGTGGAGGVRDGSTQDGDGNALVDVASDS